MPDQNHTPDTPDSAEPPSRHIRSFVLRQSRFSLAQERFHAEALPRFGIPYAPQTLDLDAVFGRSAPHILEIGFGMGETTAAIAAAQPQNDYLGIEVHTPGVGALCKRLVEQQLGNVRIIQHDAVEVVRDMLSQQSLDGIHIYFPDPWPKKCHPHRRLIQPQFIALLTTRLKPGGYLHCATDWQEYAEHMLTTFSAEALLANTSADYAPRPEHRPLTKFENRGLRLGHGVWDLMFTRKPDVGAQ
jgi:tRNA (guanine-N7-)-methyltransferase